MEDNSTYETRFCVPKIKLVQEWRHMHEGAELGRLQVQVIFRYVSTYEVLGKEAKSYTGSESVRTRVGGIRWTQAGEF